MTTIGTLFSGFGGVDVGAKAAGLTPLWGVEYDADIAGVYRRNLGDHIIVGDVRSVDYAALPRVDVLHASPSCVRASVANPEAGEAPEDIETARAVVRAIEAQQPRVFTLENVWGYRNFAAFRLILDALGAAGYMYDFEHVNVRRGRGSGGGTVRENGGTTMTEYLTHTPRIGTWAWCWYHTEYVYACWTGACWLDEQDRRLEGVTHWRMA